MGACAVARALEPGCADARRLNAVVGGMQVPLRGDVVVLVAFGSSQQRACCRRTREGVALH